MRDMKDLWDLYWTYLKIGCVNFGGGYAMLPLLERELVNKKGWTTMDELRDYFAIGQCTPGVIALNVSTFIGQKKKGVAGALAAADARLFSRMRGSTDNLRKRRCQAVSVTMAVITEGIAVSGTVAAQEFHVFRSFRIADRNGQNDKKAESLNAIIS